jgi:hypothetical protein
MGKPIHMHKYCTVARTCRKSTRMAVLSVPDIPSTAADFGVE